MSSVLYYSKYCENCKKLLYELGKTDVQKNVHFLSIDRRINRGDKIYIQLDNGHEIFMPPNITQVPSLLLLNKGNKIIVGDDVMNYFKPQIYQEKVQATENNMEPLAFSMFEMGTSMSDTYSYLDQSPDEMNAKGDGGLRQMHSFVKLNHNDSIETPPEDYIPDKVGEVDMGKLQAERDAEIKQPSISKSF
tara:strand:- start:4341 stop:4913 length:573 start_codon:yes stop_codon:yes gene_type:complete